MRSGEMERGGINELPVMLSYSMPGDINLPTITICSATHWTNGDTIKLTKLMQDENYDITSKRGGRTTEYMGFKKLYGGTCTFIKKKWSSPELTGKKTHRCCVKLLDTSKLFKKPLPYEGKTMQRIKQVEGVCWSEYNWCGIILFIASCWFSVRDRAGEGHMRDI